MHIWWGNLRQYFFLWLFWFWTQPRRRSIRACQLHQSLVWWWLRTKTISSSSCLCVKLAILKLSVEQHFLLGILFAAVLHFKIVWPSLFGIYALRAWMAGEEICFSLHFIKIWGKKTEWNRDWGWMTTEIIYYIIIMCGDISLMLLFRVIVLVQPKKIEEDKSRWR